MDWPMGNDVPAISPEDAGFTEERFWHQLVLNAETHMKPCKARTLAPMPLISKIVCGGQTGADKAGLDWDIENGIPHSGWCSKSRSPNIDHCTCPAGVGCF